MFFLKAAPFDSHLLYENSRPGEIVEVFHDKSFLVSLWDGSIRMYRI